MGRKPLTDRQDAILHFVTQELEQKGYPPSVREIGIAVGLSSSSTVHSHLKNLEKRGLIRRHPSKPRTIEVLANKEWKKPANYVPCLANPLVMLPFSSPDNIIRYYPLANDWGEPAKLFIITVTDYMLDTVIPVPDNGMQKGDSLIVLVKTDISNKELIVILEGRNMRVIHLQENTIDFSQSQQIIGKVIGLIRAF